MDHQNNSGKCNHHQTYGNSTEECRKGNGLSSPATQKGGKGKAKSPYRSWKSDNFPANYDQATPAVQADPAEKEVQWWDTEEELSSVSMHSGPTDPQLAVIEDDEMDEESATLLDLHFVSIIQQSEREQQFLLHPSASLKLEIDTHARYIIFAGSLLDPMHQQAVARFQRLVDEERSIITPCALPKPADHASNMLDVEFYPKPKATDTNGPNSNENLECLDNGFEHIGVYEGIDNEFYTLQVSSEMLVNEENCIMNEHNRTHGIVLSTSKPTNDPTIKCHAENQGDNVNSSIVKSSFSPRDRDPDSDPPLVGGSDPGLAGQASPASLGMHPVLRTGHMSLMQDGILALEHNAFFSRHACELNAIFYSHFLRLTAVTTRENELASERALDLAFEHGGFGRLAHELKAIFFHHLYQLTSVKTNELEQTNEFTTNELKRTNELTENGLERTDEFTTNELKRTNELTENDLERTNDFTTNELERMNELTKNDLERTNDFTTNELKRMNELTKNDLERTNDFTTNELERMNELTKNDLKIKNEYTMNECKQTKNLMNDFTTNEVERMNDLTKNDLKRTNEFTPNELERTNELTKNDLERTYEFTRNEMLLMSRESSQQQRDDIMHNLNAETERIIEAFECLDHGDPENDSDPSDLIDETSNEFYFHPLEPGEDIDENTDTEDGTEEFIDLIKSNMKLLEFISRQRDTIVRLRARIFRLSDFIARRTIRPDSSNGPSKEIHESDCRRQARLERE